MVPSAVGLLFSSLFWPTFLILFGFCLLKEKRVDEYERWERKSCGDSRSPLFDKDVNSPPTIFRLWTRHFNLQPSVHCSRCSEPKANAKSLPYFFPPLSTFLSRRDLAPHPPVTTSATFGCGGVVEIFFQHLFFFFRRTGKRQTIATHSKELAKLFALGAAPAIFLNSFLLVAVEEAHRTHFCLPVQMVTTRLGYI